MKKTEIEDIKDIKAVGNLSFSPDGKKLAYIVKQPDQENNCYKNNIWVRNQYDRLIQLTASDKDTEYIWDDNETVLFISDRGTEKKEGRNTDFYRIAADGGEAVKAFSLSKTVDFVKKISDGIYCMGITEDRNELEITDSNKQEREDEKDYHVIDEVPVWGNGRGYISGVRTSVYIYDEKKNELKKLTPQYMDVIDADIKDNKILVCAKEWQNVIELTDSVVLYDVSDGSQKQLLKQGKMMVSHAFFAGNDIMITATDMKPYGEGQYHDIYIYNNESESFELSQSVGFNIENSITTDSNCAGGKSISVSGKDIYFTGQKGYNDNIYQYADKKISLKHEWKGSITDIETFQGRIVFSGMKPGCCSEIYELTDTGIAAVTHYNDKFIEEHFVSMPEYIPFTDSDGVKIDGWVLEPYDYDPEKKYPGVLEIHGGPRGAYGEVFFHEMQIWASKGWFVFYCNPRGSEGYGEEFADLRGKYGTIDYKDIMEFTDHVLAMYPSIDAAHVGAAGGSYGGFMCNWIEGHTDRFAAIASQRSISNWVSDYGCSEIGVTFDKNEFGVTPWEDMEKLWDCSPLKYACNAKTPILFIHSLCDYNCTIDQGVQMFTAVKHFGVDARMCLFEGENHGLSRNGKPRHRMRRLKEMTDWFEKYLTEDQKGNN